jgi:hypothetical protein
MKRKTVSRRLFSLRSVLAVTVFGAGLFLASSQPLAATDSAPCPANSQSRQLDFWLGDWAVTYPGMPGSAASTVSLDLDQCVVVESWDGGKGHRGKNFFAYSSDDQRWHGMFTDNQGRVHIFEGTVADGSAEFTGPSRSPDGQTVLNRIKVIRVSPTKVEQSWEKSKDNGATWAVEFRGGYSRRNP